MDAEIEGASFLWMEIAARKLAKAHPDVAAKVHRALGMRILNAKKSRHYDAALGHFEEARRLYMESGLDPLWRKLVRHVRARHGRKFGFTAPAEARDRARGRAPSAREGVGAATA